jgi:hypothetical protein
MNKTEIIRKVKSTGYFARSEGPEVKCPECAASVQCYQRAGVSTLKVIEEGIRFHLNGYCGQS